MHLSKILLGLIRLLQNILNEYLARMTHSSRRLRLLQIHGQINLSQGGKMSNRTYDQSGFCLRDILRRFLTVPLVNFSFNEGCIWHFRSREV